MLTLFFLQEAMFLKNIGGPPSLQWLSRICGSTDHSIMLVGGVLLLCVGVLGFLCLCSYAALKVPEWSAMEILSLFLAQKLGGRRFFGGQFLFLHPQKGGIFMTWLYISHVFFELTPYFAGNSRASSSTHRTSSIPNDSFARPVGPRSAIFLDYFKVSNHQKRIEKA